MTKPWHLSRMILGILIGLLLGASLTRAADATLDDWPMQRGTAGGVACGVLPASQPSLTDWSFLARPQQVYQSGVPVWASPAFAVVQGRPCLFIGGADQTMYALDLATHRRIWSKITNGCIVDAPVVAWVQGRQVVFWGSSDRFVYAHTAIDGQPLWTRELAPPTNTQAQAHIPAPCFADGVLYLTCFIYDKAINSNSQQSWLCALDAATGDLLWRQELPHGQVNAPIGCRIDGQLFLFVASRRGVLHAFRVSPRGAVPAWSFQMPHEVLGSPAVWAGEKPKVFLGSKFGDLIAIDALTGQKLWHRMTGNWIDNNPCCAVVDDQPIVFTGSNDYRLYALRAGDGTELWQRPLGGEIYSAPCCFAYHQRSCVAAACLDDHLYVLNAASGNIEASYYTGQPTWDKIAKGETLWGSPIAITTTSGEAALVHGSYNGAVYLLPLTGESRFRAHTQGNGALWISIAVVAALFSLVVLPCILYSCRKMPGKSPEN